MKQVGVTDIANQSSILTDFLEVFANKLLLLDELDVAKGLGSQLDGLVETVLATVRYIHDLDDLGSKTLIKQVGRVQIGLEVGGTSENDTGNIDLVVGDEVLHSELGNLADVVVTLLLTQTGETQSRLTTTTVLLGEIDRELLDDVTSVTAQGTEQSTVTVHHNETKLLIGLQQLGKSLGMELVVTEIKRGTTTMVS